MSVPEPRPAIARPILDIAGITLRFGGLTSLDDVSLTQDAGSVLAVIGPNGAGKTSLFNCLTGGYRPVRGSARFWPGEGARDHPANPGQNRDPGRAGAGPRGVSPGLPAVVQSGQSGQRSQPGRHRRDRPNPGGPWRGGRGGHADGSVELLRRPPHIVAHLGIARTFQNIRLFGSMSAFENVRVGVETRSRIGSFRALFPTAAVRREDRVVGDRCFELLDFVGLGHRAAAPAASLPYGEQRRLEIARALGTRPSLLLLDEPAAGATAAERRDLVALIRRIAADGVSVLLIEHDMRMVAAVAGRVVVLNFGRVIAAGSAAEIRADPAVVEAYLGAGTAAGPDHPPEEPA